MVSASLSQQLGAFAAGAMVRGVPDAVAASVRQRMLDVLGIAVAARQLPTSAAALRFARRSGGSPQAHVIGEGNRIGASWAAFANGVLAHSLDFDDTHLPSVLHPSASVVPAALAAAECYDSTADELVTAIAVGLETTVRLGMAGYDTRLGNSVFFEHGQHATAICGCLGSAVAVAMLMGADAEGITNALGVSASMASGIIESNRHGGTVKRVHCGWAAHAGVVAAELVHAGLTGPPTVLEGRFGFFEAFLRGEADHDEITRCLGEQWSVPSIFFKPYPANHFTHAAIDAGMALRRRGVVINDIASLRLRVPEAVIRTIGEPLDRKQSPSTGYEAQFSGPYALVAGLLGGSGLGVGLDDFTDTLAQDPERTRLMKLVTVVPDEICDEVFPHQFPAIVDVMTSDGRVLHEEVLTNRGGPSRPLSDAELVIKFRDNVAGFIDESTADYLAERVLALRGKERIGALLSEFTTIHPTPSAKDNT